MRVIFVFLLAGAVALSNSVWAAPAVPAVPGASQPQQAPAAGPHSDAAAPHAAPGSMTTMPGAPSAQAATKHSGPTESLQEALAAAYTTNPNLLAARAQLRALDESIAQASSGWKPTVTLSGTYGVNESRTGPENAAAPKNITHPLTGQATVSQPIFRGGRTFFNVRQAKANVRAGRARLTSIEQQTFLDVVGAYFNVLRDRATLDLNQNNIAVLKRQLDAAQDRFRVGEITRTDVAQAEARLKLGETQLIQAQASLVASQDAYKTVVGRDPAALDPAPPLPALPQTEDEAFQIAKGNSPTLIAAKETEKASRAAVNAAYGALLPSVTVEGSASHSEGQSFSNFAIGDLRTDSVGVTSRVQVPLYQAGTEFASIRSAKHTASQNRLLTAQAGRDVEETVANAWENLRAATAAIASNEQQVNANQIAYEGVVQEAEVGSRTTLDVLNAEQELLNSQVALVRSQRDRYVAAYSLLASIGRLTARDLTLPVGVYDPEANARSLMWKQFWPGAGESDD